MTKGTMITCNRCGQTLTKKGLIDQVKVIRGNIVTKEMVPDQPRLKGWERTVDLCPVCVKYFRAWWDREADTETAEAKIKSLCSAEPPSQKQRKDLWNLLWHKAKEAKAVKSRIDMIAEIKQTASEVFDLINRIEEMEDE